MYLNYLLFKYLNPTELIFQGGCYLSCHNSDKGNEQTERMSLNYSYELVKERYYSLHAYIPASY